MAARPRSARLLIPCVVALFPGCGGGSGGAGAAAPPTADILFPPGACLTSEPQITVRGTAADDGGIGSVVVNGVAAASADGFATWTAAVPLSLGDNALVVSVTDAGGNGTPTAATVSVRRDGPVPQKAAQAAFVPSTNIVAFTDPELGLVATNLATGVRTIVSGPGKGAGEPYRTLPRSSSYGDLVVQASTSRAFVYDFGQIVAIDLVTGDRTIHSDSAHGTGPSLVNSCDGMALDAAGNRIFVCRFSGQTQAVDLTTGNRTDIADAVGSGPLLNRADDLAFHTGTGLLFVLDSGVRAIVEIDPTTLVRTTRSSPSLGTGTELSSTARQLTLDPAGNRAFVHASGERDIVAVDLVTGNRTPVSSPSLGTGRALTEVIDLSWQASQGRLLATLATGGVVAVDPTTGNRTVLHELTFGASTVRVIEDVALSPLGTEVIYLDSQPSVPELIARDLATGAERLVATDVLGTGPVLEPRAKLTYALDGTAAYAELDTQIVRIDLLTGDRTVVSASGTGTGPALSVHGIAAGPAPGTLSALDGTSGLLRIDLATGNRTAVAPASAFGSLPSSGDLATDPATGRVYVANDDEDDTIFQTDPAFPGVAAPFASIGVSAPSPFDGDIDGCAFDGRSSRLFVVSESNPCLLRLDPATDVVAIHSGGGVGAGPFLALNRIDGSRTRGVLVVGAGGGLVAVDAVTGERVLLLLMASRAAGDR